MLGVTFDGVAVGAAGVAAAGVLRGSNDMRFTFGVAVKFRVELAVVKLPLNENATYEGEHLALNSEAVRGLRRALGFVPNPRFRWGLHELSQRRCYY